MHAKMQSSGTTYYGWDRLIIIIYLFLHCTKQPTAVGCPKLDIELDISSSPKLSTSPLNSLTIGKGVSLGTAAVQCGQLPMVSSVG